MAIFATLFFGICTIFYVINLILLIVTKSNDKFLRFVGVIVPPLGFLLGGIDVLEKLGKN